MRDFDNHKENNEAGDGVSNSSSNPSSISTKLRAAVLGLTPSVIFKYTFFGTVLVALAAGILYHTATDSKHVNINKVDTATVVLTGSDNLGGIGPGEYKSLSYTLTNNSTSPAYVFIRIEMATPGLYEIVGSDSNSSLPDGWCELTTAESENELIFGYGRAVV